MTEEQTQEAQEAPEQSKEVPSEQPAEVTPVVETQAQPVENAEQPAPAKTAEAPTLDDVVPVQDVEENSAKHPVAEPVQEE